MSSKELSFEEVQTWQVDALKTYCHKRNLKTTGSKAELVARVFAVSEMGIPLEPTAEVRVSRTESEKAKLLLMPDGKKLPDALAVKDGWLLESESITTWPPIFLSNITLFLMADHPGKDVDFHERILNEYFEQRIIQGTQVNTLYSPQVELPFTNA